MHEHRLEMITPIRGRKLERTPSTLSQLDNLIRNDNPDKGTETWKDVMDNEDDSNN